MLNKNITCGNCNSPIDDDNNTQTTNPCPICGSLERHINLGITDTLECYEKIGIKITQEGFKKPRMELIGGDEKYVAQDKWVQKDRIIDREKNKYFELVKDPETGEIIHKCEEPLSHHFGHGSAKSKEKKN